MPLVTGGPEVKLFQSIWNLTLAYFPSFGRCFSSSFNSRMTTPVVTVFVVVSWVPMPMVDEWSARGGAGDGKQGGERNPVERFPMAHLSRFQSWRMFFSANRYTARIKSGPSFRRNMR